MILIDVNILLYAHNKSDPRFGQASSWFEGLLNGSQRACFCWETINGFIRISTNDKAIPNPYTIREAFEIVDEWFDKPNTLLLEPLRDHRKLLKKISIDANAASSLYSDAILATIAISHDATIASTDRDFRLFDGVKLINPLAAN